MTTVTTSNTTTPSTSSSTTMATAEKAYAQLITSLQVSRDKLRAIASHMHTEFIKGLQQDGHTIKMIPSYVSHIPTGQEVGTYLAIDLGGTNFRVCAVDLKGNGNIDVVFDKYTLSDDTKVGKSDKLFDFIAQCVYDFLVKHYQSLGMTSISQEMVLGFTFSFPVFQTSYSSGTISNWTKGFDCPDSVGLDAVDLLQTALYRYKLNVKVVALVNDTVGTLIAHLYKAPTTVMGIIFGTGTNAAYIEQFDQITKFNHNNLTTNMTKSGIMLINTEWGGFDSNKKILPLTFIDEALDADSTNKNEQLFEKLISGMYLGEITRRCIVYLTQVGTLFGGKLTEQLNIPNSFQTAYMSAIEADMTPNLSTVADILINHCGITSPPSLTDRQLIKSLIQQIGTRASRLSAVGIYSLLQKMSLPKPNTPIVVAIDGSVWLKYPGFQDRLRTALVELMGSEKAALVSLETACDGSGSGAGILAALAPLHHN